LSHGTYFLISELRFEISELKEKQEDLAFVGVITNKFYLKTLKKKEKQTSLPS
jgi:hypothetical protein